MKKYAIALFFVLLGNGTLIAQNLPDKGSFSAEVRVNPFDDYGKTSVLDGIKYRYFTSKTCIKIGCKLGDKQGGVFL